MLNHSLITPSFGVELQPELQLLNFNSQEIETLNQLAAEKVAICLAERREPPGIAGENAIGPDGLHRAATFSTAC